MLVVLGEVAVPRICVHPDCDEVASWQPVLILVTKGLESQRSEAELGLSYCDNHHVEVALGNLISDDGWSQICSGLVKVGRREPTRSLTVLNWRPIGFDA